MNYKYTPWFSSSMHPVRVGVYQRDNARYQFKHYSMWDGTQWLWGASTVDSAASMLQPSLSQHLRWRGLVEEV